MPHSVLRSLEASHQIGPRPWGLEEMLFVQIAVVSLRQLKERTCTVHGSHMASTFLGFQV